MPDLPAPRPMRRRAFVFAAVLVGAVAGYAGVAYMTDRAPSGDPLCQPAVALSKKLAPLARGEVAALTMATAPLKLPDLAFVDGEGQLKKLSDWRGKTVLVNLWATWCVPCRKEMPALDELQGKLGGPDFEVVAVNIDTRDPAKPKAFLADGMDVTLELYDERPISVQLPEQVEALIVEADAVVKGQTASSSYKPAILDNGVRVMVPPHIGSGTRIVVDVYAREYVRKAD